MSRLVRRFPVLIVVQYHTPRKLRQQFGSNLPISLADDEPDGYAEFLFPENDIGCFEKALQDPYYEDVISPDEQKFLDMSRNRLTVGYVETYVEAGKVV